MTVDPRTVRVGPVRCYRVPKGLPPPLCIDGHAYHRRRRNR